MSVAEIVFGVIVCVLALTVITLVMIQSGKEKSLSGTIAGAGESFFNKSKGKTKEKTLSIITSILSIIFVILAVVFVIVIAITEPEAAKQSASLFLGK
jgi:preprotein translocase subunit SecG